MANNANKDYPGCNNDPMQDARQLCDIIQSVPQEKRSTYVAITTAYMDGMIAGEAMATNQSE